jgi:hypothetical protein
MLTKSHNRLYALIEASYSTAHAEQFQRSIVTSDHINKISKSCKQILDIFPYQPFCCAYMSALLVDFAKQEGLTSYLAAGSLDFKGRRLFQYENSVEVSTDIIQNWPGHCWVVLNNVIVEISLFRTAYSQKSPKWLEALIVEHFGQGKGVIIADYAKLGEYGFSYQPEYIFTEQQVEGLLKAADLLIFES